MINDPNVVRFESIEQKFCPISTCCLLVICLCICVDAFLEHSKLNEHVLYRTIFKFT